MTKHTIDVRTLFRVPPLFALALLALAGCHDSHEGGVGSESHFLASCDGDDECGELSCIAGMCTKSCTADRQCAALAEAGECVAENADAPRTSAQICSIACTSDATCDEMGPGLQCAGGRCSAQDGADGSSGAAGRGEVDGGVTGGPIGGDTANGGLDPDPGSVAAKGSLPSLDTRTVGSCSFSTGFLGDDACLLPPPAGEGVQIHIGPRDYEDSVELAHWLINPSDEVQKCWSFQMPEAEFPFAEWQLSSRPGMHHSVFLLDMSDGRYDVCVQPENEGDVSTSIPDLLVASKARIDRIPSAMENAAIARRIPGEAPAGAHVHAFNFTPDPILIELWLNLYVPQQKPVQYDVPLRLGPGPDLELDPSNGDVASFSCPITASGRLLSLSSLTMPNTLTFEASLLRASGERITLLRRVPPAPGDSELPTTLRYDSATTNPAPSATQTGGFSGQVQLEPGDVLEWECLIASDDASLGNLCDLAGAATVALDCQ